MADLGRWLTGGYNVPGEPAADEAAPDVAADQPRVELAADGPRVEKMTTNARDSDNHR